MTFNRKELKKNAKQVLRKTYLMALIMSLILCVAGAVAYQSGNSVSDDNSDYTLSTDEFIEGLDLPSLSYGAGDLANSAGYVNSLVRMIVNQLALVAFVAMIAAWIVSALFRLFIGYHLEVGARGYFADTAQGLNSGFGRLKHGFKRGSYVNITAAMFLRSLYVALWSILLIIPGIVKGLSYSMVPYLLADNSELSHKRVLEISRQMTQGYKWKMFVLNLSFIGWELLGLLLFGIGQILVWPYINATFAQLYLKLRENAVENGITTDDELKIAQTRRS